MPRNAPQTAAVHRQTAQGRWTCNELGQTTAEYALVLLAAGTIATLVITWARGENSIDELFDLVLTKITSSVE